MTTPTSSVVELLAGPLLKFGAPVTAGPLTICPILLADEAAAARSFLLPEEADGAWRCTESGSVPYLTIENHGPQSILFCEGDQLLGGLQNRTLNVSVLVAAHASVRVNVSCVERGRWSRRRLQHREPEPGADRPARGDFAMGRPLFPELRARKLRAMERGSVQDEVWDVVEKKLRDLGAHSPTREADAVYRTRNARREMLSGTFRWQSRQVGLVAGIAGKPVYAELFEHPEAFARRHDALVEAVIVDALAAPDGETPAEALEAFVRNAAKARLVDRPPEAGLGVRVLIGGDGLRGEALVADGKVLHVALFAA